MKNFEFFYESDEHKWAIISRDPARKDYLIDTNEYLVVKGNEALITDPGGMEIFPAVFSAINKEFDARNIKSIFASHQDPDIISSLALWLDFNPEMKCYISRLWESFVPHFGGNNTTFIKIPDEGMDVYIKDLICAAIPAHYLHSSGNFHLYDSQAKILFSGDIGAALLPSDDTSIFVDNFDKHITYAEGFHKRWMGSNSAKNEWCRRVSELEIDMLCPQHGAIYQGDDVRRFIEWFAELEVGCLYG